MLLAWQPTDLLRFHIEEQMEPTMAEQNGDKQLTKKLQKTNDELIQ